MPNGRRPWREDATGRRPAPPATPRVIREKPAAAADGLKFVRAHVDAVLEGVSLGNEGSGPGGVGVPMPAIA